MSDVKMSKELKQQLAGLIPMSRNSYYEYTPKIFDDIDEKYRPVFKIKQFTQEQVLLLKSIMMEEVAQSGKKQKFDIKELDTKNKKYMELVHKVLVGWDNLYDLGTGGMFEYDGTMETLLEIPEAILTDIFTEAMRITGFIPR